MSPKQGWFESDNSYRKRIAREANERTIEDSTKLAPSRGWFESDDSYRKRIAREANERTIEDSTKSAPSQGWFESDDDYHTRIRKEANEQIVMGGTGSSPKQGWFEGDHAYRSRIADEAREVRATDASHSGPGGSITTGGVITKGVGVILLIIFLALIGNLMKFFSDRASERNYQESIRIVPLIERSKQTPGRVIYKTRAVLDDSLGLHRTKETDLIVSEAAIVLPSLQSQFPYVDIFRVHLLLQSCVLFRLQPVDTTTGIALFHGVKDHEFCFGTRSERSHFLISFFEAHAAWRRTHSDLVKVMGVFEGLVEDEDQLMLVISGQLSDTAPIAPPVKLGPPKPPP